MLTAVKIDSGTWLVSDRISISTPNLTYRRAADAVPKWKPISGARFLLLEPFEIIPGPVINNQRMTVLVNIADELLLSG